MGKAYRSGSVMQLVDNLNRDELFSAAPFFLAKLTEEQEKGAQDQATKPKVIYSFILQTQAAAEQKT